MIDVRDLYFSYGKFEALKGLSFRAETGKITGLLGPNGSGKSTTFKILSTQLAPERGDALVSNNSVRNAKATVRSLMGVTFQAPSLDPMLTVEENLNIFASLVGLKGEKKKARIEELLRRLGVWDRKNTRIKQLSGGLARRVELAKTLLGEPQLLLLDEPTTGLDPKARADFWQELRRLRDTQKMTVLVTTHLMDEAELCDELVFINDGKLAASGSPEALRKSFGREVLWVSFTAAPSLTELRAAVGEEARIDFQDGKFRIETALPLKAVDALRAKWPGDMESLNWSKVTLGDIYIAKTGRGLSA